MFTQGKVCVLLVCETTRETDVKVPTENEASFLLLLTRLARRHFYLGFNNGMIERCQAMKSLPFWESSHQENAAQLFCMNSQPSGIDSSYFPLGYLKTREISNKGPSSGSGGRLVKRGERLYIHNQPQTGDLRKRERGSRKLTPKPVSKGCYPKQDMA